MLTNVEETQIGDDIDKTLLDSPPADVEPYNTQ